MIFLKLTRSAKTLVTRFGWLFAELIFIFLGLYGAFLLERMHDDEMDLLRKYQIIKALVGEFEGYEEELGVAYETLSDAYATPFFSKYASGEKPFPNQIQYGSIARVNTGIWEALLQSGIEVLDIELIQKIQIFFKKLQDFLDLFSRFESLNTSYILPEADRNASYFYEKEGIELRDKYKWYANQLFDISTNLGELAVEAVNTHELLKSKLKETILLQNPEALFDENGTHILP
tara:strand:+ start:5636 stop:6334 length:699 start_codon:yes stop_codon:yes gene_type:complete